jgi:hypothetical protein
MSDDEPEQERIGIVESMTWVLLGVAALGVMGLFAIRCEHGPETSRAYASRTLPPEPTPVLLPPPPMDDEYFPCSDCHEGEPTNRVRRELEDEHDDIELTHGDLWCLSCHNGDDSDRLILSDHTPVDFEESWRLCTQCHGKKLPDWRAGVHGKRTGSWWGAKEYRTCVVCHDPHAPAFKPLVPEPPPIPPDQIVHQAHARMLETSDEAN